MAPNFIQRSLDLRTGAIIACLGLALQGFSRLGSLIVVQTIVRDFGLVGIWPQILISVVLDLR